MQNILPINKNLLLAIIWGLTFDSLTTHNNWIFLVRLQLMMIFNNRLVVWTLKCQNMVKDVHQCFPEPKMTHSTQRYSVKGVNKPDNVHI